MCIFCAHKTQYADLDNWLFALWPIVPYHFHIITMSLASVIVAVKYMFFPKFESTMAYFSRFSLIVLITPRTTPTGTRHEVLALAHGGMRQGAIAGHMGLTRATINCVLRRHAAIGKLVPGKSSEAPRKTTSHQNQALVRMVWQCSGFGGVDEEFVWNEGWSENHQQLALAPWLPYLYTHKKPPVDWQPLPSLLGVGTEVAEPDNGASAACHLRWRIQIPTSSGRWQA